MTAFAVQFLLTNLGLALGISLLKYRPHSAQQTAKTQVKESEGEPAGFNLGLFAGLGILLTLNSVLFVACFLAVRFSTARDALAGATLGIVIWSTYFLILIWASYSTLGSITNWIFGSVATQLHQLIKVIAHSLPTKEQEPVENIIEREIQTAFDEFDLPQQIDNYLQTMPSPQPNLTAIEREFTNFLAQLDLESFAENNLLTKIDRQTFVNLIKRRTNLSTSQVEQIVDRLESVWEQTKDRYHQQNLEGELLQFLQSADPEELQLEQLVERLEQIVDRSEDTSIDLERADLKIDDSSTSNNWTNLNLDWQAIKSALMQRVDLSDLDLEDIWQNLKSLEGQFNLSPADFQPLNTISNDIEDYLSHAPPWYLNCERGWQEYKEVIYDPQADPERVRSQLEWVRPQDLVKLLEQRDDLDIEEIESIVEQLETVRQEVLQLVANSELAKYEGELNQLVREYLQRAELSELEEEELPQHLERLLIESGVSLEVLTQWLQNWQQLDWHSWLQSKDLTPDNLEQLVKRLTQAGDRLYEKVKAWQMQITTAARELQSKLESYLRYTNLDLLTPDKIDIKLEQLWQQGSDRLSEIQQQLPDIDISQATEIIKNRKGIDTERVEQIIAQIKAKWQEKNGLTVPDLQLQTKSRELSEKLVDYLYREIAQNANLSAMEVDLLPLFNFARGKTKTAIGDRLAQINWEEVETKLLESGQGSQRQIRQKIKQAKEAIGKLIGLPRRWTTRTSQQAKDLVGELQNFFSHSNKQEFTSKNLERNLQSIVHRSTAQHCDLDRLTKLTPAEVTQFLANRQDLTSDEIAQISDRLKAIMERLSQITTQQEQTERLGKDLLDRFEQYFNSPDFLHLNRHWLQDSLANFDWQSLTDAWQQTISDTPIEELSDRLGQLSYDTLTDIVKDRFPDSTLEQIQGIPDHIARQVETLKQTAYERTEIVKQQTLERVETTRKAIATAAYWLFAISFTSVVTSMMAGYLAVR